MDSLKHLESLTLSKRVVDLFTDLVELLCRLGSRCDNIKRLELNQINGERDEIYGSIKSFQRIQSLVLETFVLKCDQLASLVEPLPLLRNLQVRLIGSSADWPFVHMFPLKCPSLEKLTISTVCFGIHFEAFTILRFFDDFNDCTQTRNVEIQVESCDETIGKFTKDQIIWRNKLVRCCDSNGKKIAKTFSGFG